MKITLMHRHHGVHTPIKSLSIEGDPSNYYSLLDGDNYEVDENKLLSAIPDGFLPAAPKNILLSVLDEDGGTGLRGLSHFLNWSKYYDAYVLSLSLNE